MNILSGLTTPGVKSAAGDAGATAVPDSMAPTVAPGGSSGPAPAVAPSPTPAQGNPPTLNPLIVGLASGKIPGLNIPHGYNNPQAEALLKPALAVGLKLFKPMVDKSVMVSVVNPKTIDPALLKKADHSNTLQKIFPSITQFFPHTPANQGKPANTAPAVLPPSPSTPPSAPSPQPVPVLPKPVKNTAATVRNQLGIANPGTPSSRPVPGGGLILNGLIQRPVG